MSLKFKLTSLFVFLVLSFFAQVFIIGAMAADEPTLSDKPDLNIVDKQVAQNLSKMTPEEIKDLDKKLADAVVLYYDRDFARALPIFKEIASKAETLDIMFWIGTSAMKTGDNKLAIEKFKKMLSVNPQLQRVRLELAATYFSMERYDEARNELNKVMESNPPPSVKANIVKMLADIEQKGKKFLWNLRLSQGIMWDSNINSGPEMGNYSVSGGVLRPSKTNAEEEDEASVTSIAGNILYDIGDSKGLMWNTGLTFYNKAYFDHSRFNFLSVDVNTGPWWVIQKDIFKLPAGFTQMDFGNDRLSYLYHIDPEYEHFFNKYFSLKGLGSYSNENFYSTTRSGLDNERFRCELEPTFYFYERKHIVSLKTGYDYLDSDDDRYTYDGPYIGISYFTKFQTNTEFFLQYLWAKKDYNEKPVLYNNGREDKRNNVTAVISQGFCKNFYASLAFSYTDNDSNADIFDYKRTTYTFNVGYRF